MKSRIDELLVALGEAENIDQAKRLILSGVVYVDTTRVDKPGTTVRSDARLEIKDRKQHPFVSRGGIKLAHGLAHFALAPTDWIALDLGASTGGFSDVLLQQGAAKIYAVDVAYGALAMKLRRDGRVVVIERFNARFISSKEVPDSPDIIVCDASFIGLQTILPASLALAKSGTWLVALIKPQFEVRRHEVGPKGVVTDRALHRRVCDETASWLAQQAGWQVKGITQSPIKGPEGNIEFLVGAQYLLG
ncbi:MAG: TlyA family rRNA (cytidine-2'-O)-methyltransferase [Candidatus Latescibacteria bacterium]|nr:TlyA family rRNA (cytidine-2'-O)-methyltransferase [Candidatus Latescibacterota bacterium]